MMPFGWQISAKCYRNGLSIADNGLIELAKRKSKEAMKYKAYTEQCRVNNGALPAAAAPD